MVDGERKRRREREITNSERERNEGRMRELVMHHPFLLSGLYWVVSYAR